MKVITEHTYGTSIYMRIGFDNGTEEEITAILRDDGTHYRTTGDGDEDRRATIIEAFEKLY